MRKRSARRTQAFTLLELVLAVGITAMVMVAINAVFFSAMRLRESASNAVEESLPVQQAFATLRRDLQGAMPPTTDGVLCGDFKVGNVASTGLSQPVDLELYTTTGVMRESEPWGEVQRVTYQLRPPADRLAPGKELIRSATRNLLSVMPVQPEEQLLMGGVDSIEYSCFDGSSWNNNWDTTVTTNLPTAVRVRILLANRSGNNGTPRPVEILVPIDSQMRTTSLTETE
jgi:general secretion pathway protein J